MLGSCEIKEVEIVDHHVKKVESEQENSHIKDAGSPIGVKELTKRDGVAY